MESLILLLFERIGLLLVFAFMVTRIPSFRHLLDREIDLKTVLYHSLIFGIFAIAGAQAGVIVEDGTFHSQLWIWRLQEDQALIGSSLVAVVIAGLLGGPFVGLGAGLIAAVYLFFLGGDTWLGNIAANPLSGLLSGFTARFFSQERVIAPEKALFIGMFAPILHMILLFIFTETPEDTIDLVDTVGIPLVVTNSIAIAVFTTMIQVALNEKEQEAASETKRALKIAEESLPHLKQGLNRATARRIAVLLHKELKIAAVSLSDRRRILAHVGLGEDHHRAKDRLPQGIAEQAVKTGKIQLTREAGELRCPHSRCPLGAAIIVPIHQSGEVAGLIHLYFRRAQQIRAVEIALAQGLSKLLSHQLEIVAAEKMKTLIQEAELRNLQAQIHPHFLFNTLHAIGSLIRISPPQAKHLTVQLGQFMRLNAGLTSTPLVKLEEELKHLRAYLEIVKTRFADQLKISLAVDEKTHRLMIPPFTLQPLVENSIRHGLKDVERKGTVHIVVTSVPRGARVQIRDNGVGLPNDMLPRLGKVPIPSAKGNGTGIYNVNQRLLRLLGKPSALSFQNEPDGGCRIQFFIPSATGKTKEESK